MRNYPLSVLLTALLLLSLSCVVHAQRIQQPLGRGVVVSKGASGLLISWRKLAQEPENATYNVYVNGTLLNAAPVSKTNLRASAAQVPEGAKVTVALAGGEAVQSAPFTYKQQAWNNVVCRIDFENQVLTPNDYKAKYAWPADLDGDGEYEWIVDRLSTADISQRSHKLQAYKMDGTCLWTIDMGPNMAIDQGQTDMVLAYDINCDGKAEVIIKSSDGTRFWDQTNNTFGTYPMGKTTADTDGDGIVDYGNQSAKNPPFYISVVDGMTGAEITSAELDYSQVHDGVDQYSRDNRSAYKSDDKYREYSTLCGHFAICYFDGVHPSLAMECHDRTTDGNHHVYVFAFDYDWTDGTAKNWHHSYTWSRNDKRPWPAETHMVRVCDVDGDGIDELMPGGYAVNSTKGMVMSAGVGHGDRYRLSDINPDRPGLECFMIQQSGLMGQVLFDAATGEHLREWFLPSVFDVGRGECMDVDPSHKGYEIYSTIDGLYDCWGNIIQEGATDYPYEGIWWDGDLQREVMGSPGGDGWGTNVVINKYNHPKDNRLLQPSSESGWAVASGWANRPLFFGDVLGDWREELVLMIQNDDTSTGMVIYSTDIETPYSMYCLQEDPHYRLDCTTRGYYQSPNTTFYLGGEMPQPQLPPVMVTDLVLTGSEWSAGSSSFTNFQRTQQASYADGKSVLIDLHTPSSITLSGTVSPSVLYAMPVMEQTVALGGSGSLAGAMDLWKSQQGTLVLTQTSHTGRTIISEGTLQSDGDLTSTVIDLRARGTLAGNATIGDLVLEGALNYEGGRLSPGTPEAPFGVITLKKGLNVNQPLFYEANLQTQNLPNPSDKFRADVLSIQGDLDLQSSLTINIKTTDEQLQPGAYTLITYTGQLNGKASQIAVMGLTGLSYHVEAGEGKVQLVINAQREASNEVVWTGASSSVWDYKTENWSLAGEATEFVAGDGLLFNDDASRTTLEIGELMPVSRIAVANDKKAYVFNGTEGGFSGEADLIKNGEGRLTINNTKSTFTGATIVNAGTLAIKEIADGGRPSSIGAATASATNFQIGRAKLIVNNSNAATNRAITLTDSATIEVPAGGVTLTGVVTGSGSLTKTGAGQLTLSKVNTYKGRTILQAGTLAMGEWTSTFGTATSEIIANGGTLVIFDHNKMAEIPTFRNRLTIPAGKTLTMLGGTRCSVAGTLSGSGTLNISFPKTRGDFSMNTANFEGVLQPTSGQFRLVAAMDLSKATFKPGAGVWAAHKKSGKDDDQALTSKIGSLQSTATDATLASGTWNVGYLGKNDTYAGKFTGALHKYGSGTLTLTGSSTGALTIHEGVVQANNTSAVTTSGAVSVERGAVLRGSGQLQNVTLQPGGQVSPGVGSVAVGTLTLKGSFTALSQSKLCIKARRYSAGARCDALNVAGNISLTNPVIDIEVIGDKYLEVGDELKIFTGQGAITLIGEITLTMQGEASSITWDTSRFATEGILVVAALPDAIPSVEASRPSASIYDLGGRKLPSTSHHGLYIVDGKKELR